MGTNELHQEIRSIVAEISGIATEIDADAHLYLEIGIPSVRALQLLMELENRYGIHIPDEEFVEATSIAKLTSIIRKLLDEQK